MQKSCYKNNFQPNTIKSWAPNSDQQYCIWAKVNRPNSEGCERGTHGQNETCKRITQAPFPYFCPHFGVQNQGSFSIAIRNLSSKYLFIVSTVYWHKSSGESDNLQIKNTYVERTHVLSTVAQCIIVEWPVRDCRTRHCSIEDITCWTNEDQSPSVRCGLEWFNHVWSFLNFHYVACRTILLFLNCIYSLLTLLK